MKTPAEFARKHLSEIVPDYLSHKNGGYVPVEGKFFDLVSLCVLAGGSPSAWQMAGKLVADAMLECNAAHGEVPNPVLHLYAGQGVAECPHCNGELSKETPILAGDEPERIENREAMVVAVKMINNPRPKCPHCYGRFESVIHTGVKRTEVPPLNP